jgi:hypothetical protein
MAIESRDEALARDAVRLYRRYQLEIVEASNLCPWAARARVEGRVKERVVVAGEEGEALSTSLAHIAELAKEAQVEVGLLLFPRFTAGRAVFETFVGRVRDADAARYELGQVPLMFAAFHPDAAADTSDPERLIPFLRRTPDPTIQVVRASVLDRVRAGTPQGTQFFDVRALEGGSEYVPPLRERIARANLATLERLGVETFEERLRAIFRDRDESRARLA